ncbi:hypothetical protein [Nocardioides zhouii]|uniref:WD40 repeat domain-containing protein n=1 Tax=Nocardioides zhouii TaxID=1168729 RepID=A0A4Q2T1W0_9ACTN|nr:hypothetical protein [Nocardioides zhouii]RYC10639.1 hypothetical protein EUA94_12695 [Nocardioides zhouii]
MTSPSHTDLREELAALAETQPFSPDPSAWDLGRRARSRTRVVRAAATLAVVALVVGVGAIAVRPDSVGPAGGIEPDGAIPSVITTPDGPVITDLAIGRASVAYVDSDGSPVLVDAATGKASYVDLPSFPEPSVIERTADLVTGPLLAVSPDGRRVAYAATVAAEGPAGQPAFSTPWYIVLDLTTGDFEFVGVPLGTGTPRAISWTTDGRLAIDVYGRQTRRDQPPSVVARTIDVTTGDSAASALTGMLAPGGLISATYPVDDGPVQAVPFEIAEGDVAGRDLPTDLYPEGAEVAPVGWAADDLLVAHVDEDLVVLTSPDRPAAESTWQVLVPDLPESSGVTVAVDLIPDLTGDPDQELTHDFTATPMGDSSGGRALYVAGGAVVLMAGVVLMLRRVRT